MRLHRYATAMGFMFGALLAGSAQAGLVNWMVSGNVTGEADVSLNGTAAAAVNVGGSTAEVINGVTFAADDNLPDGVNPGGSVTVNGYTFHLPYLNAVNANFWTGADPGGSSAYNTALDSARFNPAGGDTVTITIEGLTVGYVYEVQIWYVETRTGFDGAADRTSKWTAGNEVTLDGNGDGGSQWVIGTFTADATTQTFINGPQSGNSIVQLNMIQLRTLVPEPASAALMGMGGLFLMRRRK